MNTFDLHIYSASLYYFTTKTAHVLFETNYTLLSNSSFIFVSVWSKVALRMRWPPKRCLSLISPTWSLSCTQSFFTSLQTIWKFELFFDKSNPSTLLCHISISGSETVSLFSFYSGTTNIYIKRWQQITEWALWGPRGDIKAPFKSQCKDHR